MSKENGPEHMLHGHSAIVKSSKEMEQAAVAPLRKPAAGHPKA